MRVLTFTLLLVLLGSGCRNTKENMNKSNDYQTPPNASAGPPAIVYKTKQDYTNNVAIILTADKTEIASYPHPTDIAKRLQQVRPTGLTEGYLLDNQGINEQVAFTSYTFAEYAALTKAPSLAELKNRIIDKSPLLQLCYCGNRNAFPDLVASMNKLVSQGFASCKIIISKNNKE